MAMARRDAEPLLLPAGEAGARLLEPVGDFVEEAGTAQAVFHDVVEFPALAGEPVNAGPVGHVLVDRFRERIGLLEHHADPRPELHHVDVAAIDVAVVQRDGAGHPADVDDVVHAVEAAQERRLAAARRADQRRHLVLRQVDVDVEERLLVGVEDVDVAGAHPDGRRRLGTVGHGWLRQLLRLTGPSSARRSRRCLPSRYHSLPAHQRISNRRLR